MAILENLPRVDAHVAGQWLSPAGVLAALASIAGFLPVVIGSMAGMAATFYYVVNAMESPRVRAWLDRRAERRKIRKAAKLQYKQSLIVGELKSMGLLTHAETHVTPGGSSTQIESKTPDAPNA